jgi:hypothetical protein
MISIAPLLSANSGKNNRQYEIIAWSIMPAMGIRQVR